MCANSIAVERLQDNSIEGLAELTRSKRIAKSVASLVEQISDWRSPRMELWVLSVRLSCTVRNRTRVCMSAATELVVHPREAFRPVLFADHDSAFFLRMGKDIPVPAHNEVMVCKRLFWASMAIGVYMHGYIATDGTFVWEGKSGLIEELREYETGQKTWPHCIGW